ncbi:hypothetical protein CGLO_00046 [Colletotrichum gloeosporioides Cg-14]|uniref:Uncharacterized protein n=1 Tax=Colletotrichum gloeosporioides (strain Cg-14) TaxID=1237896 RepID=T0KVI8_COLGC|nr:hypothetical protein CGLO_00046 [Colletotrichum gloeosporioides Cg-14]
MFINEKELNTF